MVYAESVLMSYALPCLPLSFFSVACWSNQLSFWHLWVLPSEACEEWQYWGREGTSCFSAAHGFGFLNFMYCAFVLASGEEDSVVQFVCVRFGFFFWNWLSYVVFLLKWSQVFEVITQGKNVAGYSETWYFNYQIQNSSHCSATKPL